jgi:hypothetical protein
MAQQRKLQQCCFSHLVLLQFPSTFLLFGIKYLYLFTYLAFRSQGFHCACRIPTDLSDLRFEVLVTVKIHIMVLQGNDVVGCNPGDYTLPNFVTCMFIIWTGTDLMSL